MRRMMMMMICAVAVALVSLPALTFGNSLASPLISPPSTGPFVALPPIPSSRTAYVAIHFEDYDTSQLSGHDSETSFQGIRTMMASVADPNKGASKRDRVVLVPPHTPQAVRDTFTQDGLIVIEMDSTLPHKDICAPKFDRIYLWSRALAERYDRVLYLDWDVLVQRPMDHLFLCGEFCMVYNSILHFVDGLMLVKPDEQTFKEMAERYKRDRLTKWSRGSAPHTSTEIAADDTAASALLSSASMYSWSTPSKTFCWERSYLFFLEWFGNIEAAPLFKPQYGQSPLKLQRLDASAQLNAMMWYEKYSWTLMRGKEYRNMSDDQEVPALSLGFTTLKPFHWVPGLFFNLGWDWSDQRDQYLGVTHTWFIVSRVVGWLALLLFSTKGIRKLMLELYKRRTNNGITNKLLNLIKNAHMAVLGPSDGYMRTADTGLESDMVYVPTTMWSITGYWLPMYGSDIIGTVFGLVQCVGLAYVMSAYTVLIPILTAPHPAWRIWVLYHTLGVYLFNHWLFLGYHACSPLLSPAAKSEALAQPASPGRASPTQAPPAAHAVAYPLVSSIAWLAGWEATMYWFMRRTFYPEFVVKMFVLFPLIIAIFIASINMNRAVWRSIENARNAANNKDTILPGGVQMTIPTAHRS